MNQKIVFLGTPEISAKALQGLLENGFNIVAVVTKEDKVRGRNNTVEESPVAIMAKRYNVPVYKPHRLNKDFSFLQEIQPDLLLTFAYGQLISDEVLALSKYKPLNLHASLLPKYRGAAPIQYALRNGDKETGVSLMEMIHEMDAGDVYAVKKIPILEEDNYTTLSASVSQCALSLALEALPLYFEGKLTPTKQDESQVTFCPPIKKEEEKLNLDSDPYTFIHQVNSLANTPGGYLLNGTEIFKIHQAKYYSSEVKREVGSLSRPSKKELVLQLSQGEVLITSLQRPGKKIMSGIDFLNGTKDLEAFHLQ